jgi:geranylgeranyl reductase family protein
MAASRKCDVLIAGAGPAGLAAALYLLKRRPDLAGSVVAIEKSAHPRFKVCAGGLIPKTMLALDELGIALDTPAVEVIRGEARTPVGYVNLSRDGEVLCTIVRRDSFDARLARAAQSAGLEIIEHTRVRSVADDDEGVSVGTDRGPFQARVMVGADGSGSIVRRSLFGMDKASIGRALMTDIPVDAAHAPEFVQQRYRFDFRCVSRGVKGYSWAFPCLIDGRPHLNAGIYDQFPRESASAGGEQSKLLAELAESFAELPLDGLRRREISWHAFPIRWFRAVDSYARGHVMLAGDAAGVDPLMGEGISCAFEHGKAAARAIDAALSGDGAALADYDRALHEGSIGLKLSKLSFAAQNFYGRHHRLFFRIAGISRRAQAIGVDWYNGAHHLDEVPTRHLVARLARAVLLRAPLR